MVCLYTGIEQADGRSERTGDQYAGLEFVGPVGLL